MKENGNESQGDALHTYISNVTWEFCTYETHETPDPYPCYSLASAHQSETEKILSKSSVRCSIWNSTLWQSAFPSITGDSSYTGCKVQVDGPNCAPVTSTSKSHITPSHSSTTDSNLDTSILTTYLTAATTAAVTTISNRAWEADASRAPGMYLLYTTLIW